MPGLLPSNRRGFPGRAGLFPARGCVAGGPSCGQAFANCANAPNVQAVTLSWQGAWTIFPGHVAGTWPEIRSTPDLASGSIVLPYDEAQSAGSGFCYYEQQLEIEFTAPAVSYSPGPGVCDIRLLESTATATIFFNVSMRLSTGDVAVRIQGQGQPNVRTISDCPDSLGLNPITTCMTFFGTICGNKNAFYTVGDESLTSIDCNARRVDVPNNPFGFGGPLRMRTYMTGIPFCQGLQPTCDRLEGTQTHEARIDVDWFRVDF